MAHTSIDARGSFCPGPMMELIRTMKTAALGDTVSVLSSDSGSKKDIPLWVTKAGQEYVGIINYDGYDEITVKKVR